MTTTPRPIVLCILDGWGYRAEADDNAIALAAIPNYRRMASEGPWALLKTSGRAVGLPEGQMGNSEVGHMNIGGGRILVQDLNRIDDAVADGSLAKNKTLVELIARTKAAGGTFHLLGLLSPGGVHSHQDHMTALALIAAKAGLAVHVHAFLDGRDTPPKSAVGYVRTFEQSVAADPRIRVATVGGRFFGMDRDKRWERVTQAYDTLVDAKGPRFSHAGDAIETAYAQDITDEFVPPAVIGDYAGMKDGDAVLMANFRADRAREIMTALLDPAFDGFARPRVVRFSAAAGVTEYSDAIARLMPSLFPSLEVPDSLGEILSTRGLKQLRIAETEKYAHVTFFFNGGREVEFKGEERILIPSPKVKTYDLKPEMSAPEVTDRLVEAIRAKRFDVIVVNYANPDQVGHSGVLSAAIKAVEAVDLCLGRLRQALEEVGGVMLVTADHGNVEMMRDPITGEPHTAHTIGDVPVVLVNAKALGRAVHLDDGKLADLAPTILDMLAIPAPSVMTGHSILKAGAGSRPALYAAVRGAA